jgi:cytochrome c
VRLCETGWENPVEETVELEVDPSLREVAKGAAIFQQYRSACHKQNEKLVGLPVTEMVSIYTGNETGLSNWIKAPGKKREGPQMSGFPQLSDDELNELSEYILSIY